MRRVRALVLVAVAAFALSSCLAVDAQNSPNGPRLIGFFAWDPVFLGNPAYVQRTQQFSISQPYMDDWPTLEPTQGAWNQAAIDNEDAYWTRLGPQNVWPGELVWAHEKDPGTRWPAYIKNMNGQQLWYALQEHIQGTIARHHHPALAWDVTGEIFTTDASGNIVQRDNPFKNKLGADWAAQALRFAHAAAPNSYVVISETHADGLTDKSDAFYKYVREHLVNDTHPDRVPGDKLAVGLEMHISSCAPNDGFSNPDADAVRKNMQRFQALGVKVFIQGMDVQLRCAPGSYAQQLQWQKNKYHDIIAACVAVPACKVIVIEGVGDPDSWIVHADVRPSEHPVLFDDNYNPKPAYDGVVQALHGG